MKGCDGDCETLCAWCPDCDRETLHIRISSTCRECQECFEITADLFPESKGCPDRIDNVDSVDLVEAMAEKAGVPTDPLDAWALKRAMQRCGMSEYPDVTGDPDGERAGGDCVCSRCGQSYYDHPLDWRVLGYGGQAYLQILCDGQRVKL
jgi:hypothetical protein